MKAVKNFSAMQKKYISGELFSPGMNFKIPGNYYENGRICLLEKICAGKKVLHIGCADHAPLIKSKVEKNNWLHAILEKSADTIIGVDISSDGVKEASKYTNSLLLTCNITNRWPSELEDSTFDIAVLGEILEHIDNPALFLLNLKKQSNKRIKRLIITVPNAWSSLNITKLLSRHEYINTDHRYWFTTYTLAKVLNDSGWKTESFTFVDPTKFRNPLKSYIRKALPHLSETIVLEASEI